MGWCRAEGGGTVQVVCEKCDGASCRLFLVHSEIPGEILPENPRTQFARPEFSVFQLGVSSSVAVTTYPGGRACTLVKCSDDGDAETMIGKRRLGKSRDASPRQCYSKRLTERLRTPDAKTEQAITSLGRSIPDIS